MKKRITPTIRNVFLITLIALFFIASTSFVSANNIVHKIADGTNNGFWVTTNIGLSHHTTCTAQGGGFVAVSPQSNAAATGEAIPQEFVDVAKTAGITNFNTIFKSGCWAGQNINCNNPNIYLPNPRTFHIGIFAYAQNQVIDADPTDLAYVHYCSLPNEPTTECSDGLDNDNDGLVDMYDPDCSNRDDDKEEPDTRQCNDNIDNDGNSDNDDNDDLERPPYDRRKCQSLCAGSTSDC